MVKWSISKIDHFTTKYKIIGVPIDMVKPQKLLLLSNYNVTKICKKYLLLHYLNMVWLLPAFENSVVRAPGTTKKVAGQPKYSCGCPTDNHNFLCPSCETRPTDNQKLGRTTRNCNLVVRGTTIYFSLIRTLIVKPKENALQWYTIQCASFPNNSRNIWLPKYSKFFVLTLVGKNWEEFPKFNSNLNLMNTEYGQ